MKPHVHRCAACPNILTCHQHQDQCVVSDPYLCPNCEQQRLDDYLTQHEPQPQPTPQETNHEGF